MTSWKCHDVTAWLETVPGFCIKVGSLKKKNKNSRYTGRCFTGDDVISCHDVTL